MFKRILEYKAHRNRRSDKIPEPRVSRIRGFEY